jgi:SAM-dependent methyltransferase
MKKDCWFKDWFDSKYYHLLYNKRDDKEADFFITNLCSYLHLQPGARVWDLACGKGRHTMAFARKGFNATGTDLARNSIMQANENKEANTEFYVHDMRKSFRVNYFDCVVNLFTSIGYFENYRDNFQVFRNVHTSLKPGGFFVVDFFNSNKVRKAIKPGYVEQRGDITFRISKHIENNVIHKKINFEDKSATYEFEETVTLLEKQDFEKFAEASGFAFSQVFGNYSLEPFDEETSDRLILILKK